MSFLRLPAEERREALGVAATASGRPAHLLEKDVWVVWALNTLFTSPLGAHLVFKGGTALSKVWRAIRRFSEDVDLTYDIRALAPDLVGDAKEALPRNRSEEKRWTSEIRSRLPGWVTEHALPVIVSKLRAEDISAKATAEGEKIYVAYEQLIAGTAYVAPRVMLEFGARSTGEPCAVHKITCDAAESVNGVTFPTARPRVMHPERTFWEKATLAHVFCEKGCFRGERFARHWYDVAQLDVAGFAETAIADRKLAEAVARHKAFFWPEKTSNKSRIDYEAAVSGGLRLVPDGQALRALADDYSQMIEGGLLLDQAEPFDDLMMRCDALARRANEKARAAIFDFSSGEKG